MDATRHKTLRLAVLALAAGCLGSFPAAERYVEEVSQHSLDSQWYLREASRLCGEARAEVRRDERTAIRAVKALAGHLRTPETFLRTLDVYNMIWSRGPAIELDSTRAIMDEIVNAVEDEELTTRHRVRLAHYWVTMADPPCQHPYDFNDRMIRALARHLDDPGALLGVLVGSSSPTGEAVSESFTVSIQDAAVECIQVLSGEDFGYSYRNTDEEKAAVVERCREWLAANGYTTSTEDSEVGSGE